MKTEIDFEAIYKETTTDTATRRNLEISFSDHHGDIGEIAAFHFEDDLRNRLGVFAVEHEASPFMVLFTACQVLLWRYNSQERLWGKDASGGIFRVECGDMDGAMPFAKLLEINKIAPAVDAVEAFAGNVYSKAVWFSGYEPDSGLLLGNIGSEANGKGAISKLIFFTSTSTGDGLVRFDRNSYTEDGIRSLIVHFRQLLVSLLREPYQSIGKLPMLTSGEEYQLLKAFNDTERSYDVESSLVTIFEQQVRKSAQRVALYQDDQSMTYDELNRKANQLARHLAARGVKSGDNVGLLVDRSFDMITGMFAILKCGAAYVPITPDYPADRQQYILKQSSVSFLLTNIDHSHAAAIGTADMRTIAYDTYEDTNLNLPIDSRQLVYTIYTSGSTGVPKGVMIEHHSAINLISWVNTEFNVGADDRLLCVTSMGFDLSVYDIFGMLAAGGAVVIAKKEDVMDVAKLAWLMQHFQITFWDSVPSTLDYLVNHIGSENPSYRQEALRLVFLSGDWIPLNLPGKIRGSFPNARVISLGGATEGTVWSNYYVVDEVSSEWHSIPYGRPIANNAFYILNDQLQPVPQGVVGELFIGGVGVARGYANDAEKTQRSFLPDPFNLQWGARMYRTGDLGRMTPDGFMELIGRKDSQVKIRGYRVELGEIEHVIRQCETVSNAVVLQSADKKQLVAYVVPSRYYDRDTVVATLRKKLPDYMIPDKWTELDALPLTANGKIDTKSLREIDSHGDDKIEVVAPRNELEAAIAAVWQKVLKVSEISIHDNFFNLGGQSLMAVELITEMKKAIGKDLPVNILYKYPTIAQLHSFLQGEGETKKWKSLVAVKPTGSKIPMYIVHGDGLSISNFHNLAEFVDHEQPVFSLQPVGLNGTDEPLENLAEIARHYVAEISEHNPDGPYALGGYSFGGYVAIEMKRQLEEMGKVVKLLAIFDTNAENVIYKQDWVKALPRRIKRQVPKFLFIAKSMFTHPGPTIAYQYTILSKKLTNLCYSLGIKDKPELTGINKNIDKINETHFRAFRNYHLAPFSGTLHLFKAQSRSYYVDDFEYLGWTDYAQGGVKVYEAPGDHKTMFEQPNVSKLARLLQNALDDC